MSNKDYDDKIMVAIHNNTILINNNATDYYLGHLNKETNKYIFTVNLGVNKNPIEIAEYLENNPKALENINKIKGNDLKHLISTINSHLEEPDDILNLINNLADCFNEYKTYGESPISKGNINNITDEKALSKLDELDRENKATAELIRNNVKLATDGTKGEIIQVQGNEVLKDGLYYKKEWTDKKGEDRVSHTLIGNLLINELKLTYDKLKGQNGERLFPPVVTIRYTNTITKEVQTIYKKPYEAIANSLINDRLIDSNNLGIENLLNKIWVQGVNNIDFITAETDLLKDGFFMDMENNKVLSNNVFEDLKSTKEDIKQAIKLFNSIIANRGTAIQNDCTLFRFMLWSPFGYCLKQLGFTDGLYSMVLWGVTDTNKTGSSVILSNLYTDKATTLQKANTQSAIGTRLGENTFPLILDEAKDNLENPNDEEFNKNIVTDEMGRAVKDRTNNNLMVEFPALRLTVRTLNQDIEYKDEFLKRHKVLYYDTSMKVKEADKMEFNKKFKPNAPNTPLRQLKHLGKAFADKFIPYLETQSDKLYNLEDLTIAILKEIQEEAQEEFNLNVMIKQKITQQSTDTASIIQTGLNKILKSSYKLPYGQTGYMEQNFIDAVNMGAISWLDYQPRNKLFVIKVNEFEKDISAIVGQHIPIAETFKLLGIPFDPIKKGKFKGKSHNIVKLNTYNLTYKLFDINIYDFEELQELQAEEEEIKQREEEFNKIANAKPIK